MNMKTKSSNTDASDVAEQMAILRADIGALTAAVSDLAVAKGNEVSDVAKQKFASAKDAAAVQANAAKQQAGQLQDQANEFVRTQPATAVGMAAAVGFVIGMLISRK